jgi:hypothetical protein
VRPLDQYRGRRGDIRGQGQREVHIGDAVRNLSHPGDTLSHMKTIDALSPPTTTTPGADAEHNLAAAGFTFAVVESCPHPRCEVCAPPAVRTAA